MVVAIEAADAADAETLPRFRHPGLEVRTKSDATPVTEADRAAESAIRGVLQAKRPNDAVLGEEYGESKAGPRTWVIDPIDATVNFVAGVPVWGTLIALEDEDGPALGVVSAPALGMRWWGGRDLGAWANARPIRVSTTERLEEARLSFNSIVEHERQGFGSQITALTRTVRRTRGFGDFWSFMLLAEGAVDVVVEPLARVWDLAPLLPIVEAAGGRFTSISGEVTIAGGNAVATNGLLHEAVLAFF
jgi:histidinol-phosphatase